MTLTVIAATNESPTSHAQAIDRTALALPHPVEKILVSKRIPQKPFSGRIVPTPEWFPDGKYEQRELLSRMMLEFMPTLVQTEFALFVQWDGFAINPQHWTDAYLEYDYIGAPWPWKWNPERPERRVGCGGFSLRSKRWLDACLTLPVKNTSAEDTHCCCFELDHFLKAGCRVAPLALAQKFALEHGNPEFPNHTINDSFGFHWRGHFGKRKDLTEPPIE